MTVLALAAESLAQGGLRASLERLDVNENGEIEPDEITPLARPYLERVARARRMSLDRPNDIDEWQEAARIYYALRNGVSRRDIVPNTEIKVKPFGPTGDDPIVPEFGLPQVKYRYIQEDLDEADRTIRRYDYNRDGYVDRAEAAESRWTHRDPFQMDLDKDNRPSRLELTQRYARRRMLDDASDEVWQQARRVGYGTRPSSREEGREDPRRWSRGGSSYLTSTVMGRFDLNRNGRLDGQETASLGVAVGRIDLDRDGEFSRVEVQTYLTQLQEEAGDVAAGLPSWFYELDKNRDKQIAMSEFTSEWTDAKVQEFAALDANDDGFLTSAEASRSTALTGGSYRNTETTILVPRTTIVSEIDVPDDFVVGDLNVQVSITHTYLSHLDVYLTGPAGQRIELMSGVGGSGDHLDQTVFDDQSRYPITKARAPYKGTFMPTGLLKRQPSLSHYNGKTAKGVWQLVVRGSRSDRTGLLHSWVLVFRPADSLDGPAAAPGRDGPSGGPSSSSSARRSESHGQRSSGDADNQRRSESEDRKREFIKKSIDKGEYEKKELDKKSYNKYEKKQSKRAYDDKREYSPKKSDDERKRPEYKKRDE